MLDIQKFISDIESLTVAELNELVKAIEEKFGVSAAAMAVAAPAAGGAAAAEEKTEFTVMLKDFGANKIAVIKAVREITGLGLAESKTMVESAPVAVKENIAKEAADEMVAKLKELGATVKVNNFCQIIKVVSLIKKNFITFFCRPKTPYLKFNF